MFGPWQIVIIVAVIILLFGTKKLPELAKAMRLSVDEFKGDKKEGSEDKKLDTAEKDKN